MTVASRAVMMAVMTEARTTDVEQEGLTSHTVLVAGGGGRHFIIVIILRLTISHTDNNIIIKHLIAYGRG